MAVQIVEIDFGAREVTTSDHRRLPITDLFDRRGRPTEMAGYAVLGVAGSPGDWLTFKLMDFDPAALQ